MKCPACGAKNPDEKRFCGDCGHAFSDRGQTGQLNPDTILHNRYIVVRILGQGGMGAVYQALDTRLNDSLVAIKEMSTSMVAGDLQAAIESFRKEAALLTSLQHPALPRIIDFFSNGNDRWYLVMDYIEGATLAQVARSRGLIPEAEVLEWARQLCKILDYLHNQQPPIIFRDLKPANIILTPQGQIKLIDFGIARHFRAGCTSDTSAYGSHGFAPPEQYGEDQTTPASDVYALGATMHYLLTGIDPSKNPFIFDPPREIVNVSPRLDNAIMRALELKADKRPQSMQEMFSLLPPGEVGIISGSLNTAVNNTGADFHVVKTEKLDPQELEEHSRALHTSPLGDSRFGQDRVANDSSIKTAAKKSVNEPTTMDNAALAPQSLSTNKPAVNIKLIAVICVILLVIATGAYVLNGYHQAEKTGNVAGTEASTNQLDTALEHLSQNHYQNAIETCQAIIKNDSKNAAAYQGIGLAYVLEGDTNKAEQTVQQGLQEMPGNVELQLTLAGLLSEQGKNEEIQSLYQSAIESNPESLPACQAYYHWMTGRGQLQGAVGLLEGLRNSSDQYSIENWLAGLYLEMGQNENALLALRKSLELQEEQSVAYELLEDYYEGRWSDLAALGNDYIQQDQTVAGSVLKMRALYKQGLINEAVDQYKESPQEVKDSCQAKYVLIQAYLQSKSNTQAKGVMKRISAAEIKDAALLSDLAACCLDMGNVSKARELALQGIAVDGTNIDCYLVMYRSYRGENAAKAQEWALRYIMNSGLGYVSRDGFYQEKFVGTYSGSEAGTFEAVISRDRQILVTGNSPTINTFNGSGTLNESGSLSFETSGSIAGGSSQVYRSFFQGGLQIQNGEIIGSGSWTSRDVPNYGGTWSISPVTWGSSTQRILELFAEQS